LYIFQLPAITGLRMTDFRITAPEASAVTVGRGILTGSDYGYCHRAHGMDRDCLRTHVFG
jgi:hypothetical protein